MVAKINPLSLVAVIFALKGTFLSYWKHLELFLDDDAAHPCRNAASSNICKHHRFNQQRAVLFSGSFLSFKPNVEQIWRVSD